MKKLILSTVEKLIYIRHVKDFIFITMGVLLASVGLKGFLLPNNFLDGGATGVSLLLQLFSDIELSVFIVLVNLPFIFLGARQISRQFAIKSALAILALSVLVHYITFPTITSDKLLISIFGGFFPRGGHWVFHSGRGGD